MSWYNYTCLLIWTVFSGERCGPWASCSACIHFPLCPRESQSCEKCKCVNLTHFCKLSTRLKLSFGIPEKFTCVQIDLIHNYRLEFANKTWCVNNLIYNIWLLFKSGLYFQTLQSISVNVTDAIVLLDREQGGKSALEQKGIKLHRYYM